MHGQVVNVPSPSAGINTVVLRWEIIRVLDGMYLQEYPPTINTSPSNANMLFLQADMNQSITAGYNFSSQQSLASSFTSSQPRTQNWQRQQDEYPGLPKIAGIHRPSRRSRIDADEEK